MDRGLAFDFIETDAPEVTVQEHNSSEIVKNNDTSNQLTARGLKDSQCASVNPRDVRSTQQISRSISNLLNQIPELNPTQTES